jgi:hypothetical protein
MLMVELLVNENLLKAEFALNQANSGNIIELCREYLRILTEYRDELYKLRGSPEITLQQSSALARELTQQVRKAIRSALEITTRERNKTESLLESLTSISGYEAIDTFNRLKYKGFDDWQLGANSIRPGNNGNDGQMTMQEAVDAASLLRREAYIMFKTTFLK